jgi:hypothetical protein
MRPKKKSRKKENHYKKVFKFLKLADRLIKILSKEQLDKLYLHMFHLMGDICTQLEYGDPFSYARSKEIYMSCVLGHNIAKTYSGEDASCFIDDEEEEKEMYEYKSTTPGPKAKPEIKGSYTGISVLPTWQEQEQYLKTEKIGCYDWHYYGRFEGPRLVEVWRIRGSIVLELLLPKLKSKYAGVLSKKDPRLSATITQKEIYKYGEQVELPKI